MGLKGSFLQISSREVNFNGSHRTLPVNLHTPFFDAEAGPAGVRCLCGLPVGFPNSQLQSLWPSLMDSDAHQVRTLPLRLHPTT